MSLDNMNMDGSETQVGDRELYRESKKMLVEFEKADKRKDRTTRKGIARSELREIERIQRRWKLSKAAIISASFRLGMKRMMKTFDEETLESMNADLDKVMDIGSDTLMDMLEVQVLSGALEIGKIEHCYKDTKFFDNFKNLKTVTGYSAYALIQIIVAYGIRDEIRSKNSKILDLICAFENEMPERRKILAMLGGQI